jgi:signal transduction histidine kinase
MLLGRAKQFITSNRGLLPGVALSIGIGLLFHQMTSTLIDRDNNERFVNMANTAKSTINARIVSYTNMVRATASFFGANGEVNRATFHRFVSGLNIPEQYPAIETANYVHSVTDDKRDAFEEKIRREDALANDGRPPFKITPPGRRPTYSVVLYIEPNPDWMQAVGFDLDADPLTRQAMALARDRGVPANSGAPIKAMKARGRIGFGMRLPVYRFGAPLNSVEERRTAYVGSVGIAFNVARLVQGVLAELPVDGIRMILYNDLIKLDPSTPKRFQLIYDSSATGKAPPPPAPSVGDPTTFQAVMPIQFNGREWRAHFSVQKQQLYSNLDAYFPLLASLAGFTTTMLLYGVFYTLKSSRQRAVELARDMTKELRESQSQLLQSHRKLRELAAHLDNIKEYERKRIAREIHDDLGQNLLALRIDAELLLARTGNRHPHLHARAATTLGQIDATIKSVRQIINDLRPNVLDLGLNAAVAWQIAQFRQRAGIECELVEYNTDIKVSDQCATGLFRILQESLSNVVRHARAKSVRVDLRVENDWVGMSVHDDGIGLPLLDVHKNGAFGLIGIEERVRILGGTFSLNSAPGRGTTLSVTIPAHGASPAASPAVPDPTLGTGDVALV